MEPDELAKRYAEKTPANARRWLTHVRGKAASTARAEETTRQALAGAIINDGDRRASVS